MISFFCIFLTWECQNGSKFGVIKHKENNCEASLLQIKLRIRAALRQPQTKTLQYNTVLHEAVVHRTCMMHKCIETNRWKSMAIYLQIDGLVKLARGPWHLPINKCEVFLNPENCWVHLRRKNNQPNKQNSSFWYHWCTWSSGEFLHLHLAWIHRLHSAVSLLRGSVWNMSTF